MNRSFTTREREIMIFLDKNPGANFKHIGDGRMLKTDGLVATVNGRAWNGTLTKIGRRFLDEFA